MKQGMGVVLANIPAILFAAGAMLSAFRGHPVLAVGLFLLSLCTAHSIEANRGK